MCLGENGIMNIFFLDLDPKKSAKYYFDRHCVKIILEICQMLYTAQWICHPDFVTSHPEDFKPYKKTHYNHPTAKWVRRTRANYNYTCLIGLALCREYTHRYNKTHKCEVRLQWLSENGLTNVDTSPYIETTYLARTNVPLNCSPIPLAMPREFHCPNVIDAYRHYYIHDKKHIPTIKEGDAHTRLALKWKIPIE